MPIIQYKEFHFRPDTLALIDVCNAIVGEYQRQGFRLTLRQLYYQLVSRDVIPNRQKEYKRLGSIVNDARLAGLIDWSSIEDRTRNVEINSSWENPESIIHSAAQSYHNDLWLSQPHRVEVWVEKDALEGVIESVCSPLDVPFFSCRGYTSQTAVWEAAQRIKKYLRRHEVIIFHLGDHDPSGIDMTRDIRERLSLFTGHDITIKRLALNMDQVEEYNPPPNPAKSTDSRFNGYVNEHGDESWELDALEPSILVDLIQKNIEAVRDEDAWDAAVAKQEQGRTELQAIADNYEEAVEAVRE